jgi:methylisocitrate lyase
MEAKIREAVAARRDADFVIIGRTDAAKTDGIDEAMRRGERYRRAGADMLFIYTRNADEMRVVGERFAPPLMIFAPRDGTGALTLSLNDLSALGYRVIGVPVLPLLTLHHALRQTYEKLARFELDPALGTAGAEAEMKAVHKTVDLERLLEVERRTSDL